MKITLTLIVALITGFNSIYILDSPVETVEKKSAESIEVGAAPVQKKKKEHPGKALFLSSSCINCHGVDLKGIGSYPPLLNLAKKYKPQDIEGFIKNGKGGMPPNFELEDEEVSLIALYLLDKAVPTPKKAGTAKK